MIRNILIIFDVIYKLFKLQFCILFSLLIGLFIFTVGPTLYSTSAIVNEIIDGSSTSVVRAYFKYFNESFRETWLLGAAFSIFTIFCIIVGTTFRYRLTGLISILANLYFLIVLITVLIMFILFSIIREYRLTKLESIKKSLEIMKNVPFVPLFLVLWTIACSIIFSTIIGLYIMIGFSFYFGGIFGIVNYFIIQNERVVER